MWEKLQNKNVGAFLKSYKLKMWGLFCKTAPTPPKNLEWFFGVAIEFVLTRLDFAQIEH